MVERLAVATLLVLAALVPAAQGQSLPALVLVGVDPAGDSKNLAGPNADVGAAIDPKRTDILGLQVGQDDKTLYVKLNIGVQPSGTGGYMCHVLASAKGTTYSVCYNVQFTGNQADLTQEDTLGCSRFTGATAVGPTTSGSDAVQLGDEEGGSFILWPVPRADMGDASVADLSALSADTWFRGASTCCAPSTTQSQYLWNRADVGPDDGTWSIDPSLLVAPGPAFQLALDATANRTLAAANGTAQFTVQVRVANGTAPNGTNVTLRTSHLPDGWNATFAPENVTVAGNATTAANVTSNETGNGTGNATGNASASSSSNAPSGNGTVTCDGSLRNCTASASKVSLSPSSSRLTVHLPANATLGTYNFTVEALVDGNASALATLVVEVVPASSLPGASGNGTSHSSSTTHPKSGKGAPGPGPVPVLAAVGLLALLRRRRA